MPKCVYCKKEGKGMSYSKQKGIYYCRKCRKKKDKLEKFTIEKFTKKEE
jgi:hypothetical protein